MKIHRGSSPFPWKKPALVLAFALLGLGLTACGDSGASQDEIEAARQQGATKAREQQKIHEIEKELQNLKKAKAGSGAGSGAAVPPSGGSGSSGNCGGSLSVNEHTTCSFAENVEDAYYAEIGSGSGVVYAYSPSTGQTYSMYCSAGSPHECTGGNDAAAYFP